MPVSFRPAARADLLRQFEYFLEVANAELAHRFLDAVEAAALRLSEHPRIGALQGSKHPLLQGVRAWPIPEFEDILCFYVDHEADVEVLRVLHGRRDIVNLLLEER